MKKIKTVTAVGLDIGTHTVKCVQMTHDEQSIKLHRVSILPVTGSSKEAVMKTLPLLFETSQPLPKNIRISVKGSSLLMRRIQLPMMTPAELKSAIRFEAEGQIPFSIEDCILDFQILDKDAEKKIMHVLLVAAKKDYIEDRLGLLKNLGVKPEVIDVDIFCLVNAFEMLNNDEQNKTYGLLNIGHEVSSFAIIHEKLPFFVREIPLGGARVTRALMELKGISENEADLLKLSRLPEHLDLLKEATRKGFEALVDELEHSINYFENETEEEIKFVWMSGGGAMSFGAGEILSGGLKREVSLWDNTKKMEVFGDVDHAYLREHSHELNVAFGMVLRGLGKPK
jgi:type IV pilus assembly protein PilM